MSEIGLTIDDSSKGVRRLMLDRPDRLNAINLAMLDSVEAAVEAALSEDEVRTILLCGAGRAFCAGDDIETQAEVAKSGEAALRKQLTSLQRVSELLTLGAKPVVVAAKGWAVGAGLSWTLNSDFAIWGRSARGFFPEIGFGTFVTGGATWLLPRLTDRSFAREMLLLGRRITGEDAFARRLAAKVVPDEEVDLVAAELATRLAELPVTSVTKLKRALAGGEADAFRSALSAEFEACLATSLDPRTITRMLGAISAER